MDIPFGYFTSLKGEVLDCVYQFSDIVLMGDLYVLDFKDFDVILGVDCLRKHHACWIFGRERLL